MKRLLKFMFVLLVPLVACSDNEIMQSTLPTGFDTDALTGYEIPAEPGPDDVITFTVKNPFECTIESDQKWCEVKVGWKSGIYVNLAIADNETSQNRIAKITLSSPKIKEDYVIEVNQLASAFELKGLEGNLKPEGEERILYVSSDSPWTLESDEDWIEFDKKSGDMTITTGAVEVKAIVKANDTGIIRFANVTLCSASGKKTVNELLQCEPWNTEVRVGDPDVKFDMDKVDPHYGLKMTEWMAAGVRGGIPELEELMNGEVVTFEAGTTANELNTFLEAGNKYQTRVIFLKNGEYVFDKSVRIYSNNTLVGESRDGVIIKVSVNSPISLYNIRKGGIRNLTIVGDWSNDGPDPTLMEETLPGKGAYKTIDMNQSQDAYIDNVKIINSASHPIWVSGNNNTIRDVEIDGAYNKGGGCQGYFFIDGHHQLITGCKVTHLRHISFQNPTSKQNVFYKNDVAQEISFHTDDGGDNLIEYNRITIPVTLKGYNAIMGPWSSKHKVGGKNFIYRNRCVEENRDNYTPWSDNELYIGPMWVVGANDPKCYDNFQIKDDYPNPVGKTLYPVILK